MIYFVVGNLGDQTRATNAFSGQNPEDAYAKDLLLYNSQPIFATMAVTKRHLHGKKGIYALLFGIAASLRSQLIQNGREKALTFLTYKALNISTASMIREGRESFVKNREEVFDNFINIANNQLENTTNPERMTRTERAIYDKEGPWYRQLFCPFPLLFHSLITHNSFKIIFNSAETIAKRRKKERSLLKKLEKERKASEKSEFGLAVIDSSERGSKSRRDAAVSDDEDDIDSSEDDIGQSAAYKKENKVAVPVPLSRKKSRASAPVKGHVLSAEEIREQYPDIDLCKSDDDDDAAANDKEVDRNLTQTHSVTLTEALTLTHTHSLTLTHTQLHSLTHTQLHSLTHTHTQSHSLTHTQSHSLSLTHTHSVTLSYTH
jgi:hypothetical protein